MARVLGLELIAVPSQLCAGVQAFIEASGSALGQSGGMDASPTEGNLDPKS